MDFTPDTTQRGGISGIRHTHPSFKVDLGLVVEPLGEGRTA